MDTTKKILVVEDEGIVAQDIQHRLQALGYEITAWVTSGEDALREVEKTRPDLVMMDIRLHGEMDGIQAAAEIRRRHDIPVVYLTAYADVETLERAKPTGPFGYVLKPFEERDLLVTVELALFKHGADREIADRERWLATTLRSIGDAVIATDEAGRVKLVNPVAERLTGWSFAEAVGRPLAEVLTVLEGGPGETATDPVAQLLDEATVMGFRRLVVLRSRDGRETPIGDSAAAITDESGATIGMVIVFRDLTNQLAAQERVSRLNNQLQQTNKELEDEKGFLSALFESIPSAVVVVSERNGVRFVNRSLAKEFGPITGMLEEKLVGEVLGCLGTQEGEGQCGALETCDVCRVRNAVSEALSGRQVQRQRAELHVRDNGSVRSLVLMVSAAPVDYQNERMALLVLEDATELSGLRALVRAEAGFAGIVGRHQKMLEVYEMIREVSEVSSPVLIQGESGTGKELVARAVHTQGPRASRNFVPVSCGALPEGLLESELFGHVKGSFTGAIRDKKGRFELADGGTIFLDEVGELSPAMQVKLLRVLQERCFERVGGEKTIEVDVRVISASNKDLRQEVAAGRFREDLFYRLCVVPIHLPSLRERVNDIPLIADHILAKAAAVSGRPRLTIDPEAVEILMDHPWPGNVRELQNALEFALIKCRGVAIEPAHLPPSVRSASSLVLTQRGRPKKLTASVVQDALRAARGNKVQAAKVLGVSRATLYRFLGGAFGDGSARDVSGH